jgi:hypothetical protein
LPRHTKREVFSVTARPDHDDGSVRPGGQWQIQLRATGGWRKIAAVLSEDTVMIEMIE